MKSDSKSLRWGRRGTGTFATAVGTIAICMLSISHARSAPPSAPADSGSAAASATGHPNIVFILVDDMGYGDSRCYNPNSKIETANINALAAAGMRFTDAHAPGPLCHMSRYGLMTGRYPFRAPVHLWPTQPLIEPNQETIASLLRRGGYRTHMVGKWHLGFKEDGYERPLPGGPVDVGFDSFFGIRASTDIPPYFYIRDRQAVEPPSDTIQENHSPGWSPIQGAFWRQGGIAPNLKLDQVLPRLTQEAIQVIEQHPTQSKQPMMLYLAYPSPHTPWLPSEEFVGKSSVGMYGDFLMMVDAHVGRVLKALDDKSMADETLVIFTSDNGPCWYDADDERSGHDSSGGLRGMKADAWEGGHRMPMIVRWPGHVKPGSKSDRLVSFVDWLATFAELTGTALGDDAGPDSISFASELTGASDPSGASNPSEDSNPSGGSSSSSPRQTLVMRSGSGHMTIRSGPWKLIDQLGSGGFSRPPRVKPSPGQPAGQLYHLGDDLGEQNNLYAQRPEIVRRLLQEMAMQVDAQRTR